MEGMRPAPYSEHLPRAAPRRYVLCTWTARMARKEAYVDQVLPDACMDVFWDGSDIWVAGPDTGPVSVSREPGSVIVGIRFRPGAGPAILGPSGHELLNARPRLADIWGRRAESLAARLHDSGSADEARTVLDAVFAREAGFRDPDDAMELVVLLLSAGPSQLSIRGVASEVGLSERQLHRRSLRSFGYALSKGVKSMRSRLSIITLGVRDLERARSFYSEGLGWPVVKQEGNWLCFDVGPNTGLALFPWDELAVDAALSPVGRGFRGVTLSYVVASDARVDEVLQEALEAGGRLVKPAGKTEWGGYAGYFADPDDHLWEVAHAESYRAE
jgi:catechol 2,3-dioxygenase-like lactoylglutathione lyase family enzyme